MNYYTCSSAVLCSFLAFGCSTHTLKETREVSASAIALTSSVDGFLATTVSHVIDLDSDQLSMNSKGPDSLRMLEQKNNAIKKLMREVRQFRKENQDLRRYFEKLQALANSPLSNNTSESLGRMSRSLSEIDSSGDEKHLNYHPSHALTGEQQSYIQQLSQSVVGAHYAGNIKKVLLRDRMIVANQLLRHERQLRRILRMLKRRLRAGNMHHYTQYVLTPYAKGMPGRGWKVSRRKWFEAMDKDDEVYDDMLEANRELRQTWLEIFEGKQDLGRVRDRLGDVDKFVADVQAFDKSRNNPYGEGVIY